MGTNAYAKTFRTKPFAGYKMGTAEFKGKMVIAIPQKRLQEARDSRKILMVQAKDDPTLSFMEFYGDEAPLAMMQCHDKYGRQEDYMLYYYIWNPKRQLSLL